MIKNDSSKRARLTIAVLMVACYSIVMSCNRSAKPDGTQGPAKKGSPVTDAQGGSAPADTSGATESKSGVRTTIRQAERGSSVLSVSVINVSRRPVTIYRDMLPWANRYSLTVLALPSLDHEGLLKATYRIDDFGPSRIDLEPGKEYNGNIDLADRFPDLKSVLAREDVFIFWTYELKTSNRETLGREFGGCTLHHG